MVIAAIIMGKHSSFGQLTDNGYKEQLFLLQTGVLCFVDFICWTPSIALGMCSMKEYVDFSHSKKLHVTQNMSRHVYIYQDEHT